MKIKLLEKKTKHLLKKFQQVYQDSKEIFMVVPSKRYYVKLKKIKKHAKK